MNLLRLPTNHPPIRARLTDNESGASVWLTVAGDATVRNVLGPVPPKPRAKAAPGLYAHTGEEDPRGNLTVAEEPTVDGENQGPSAIFLATGTFIPVRESPAEVLALLDENRYAEALMRERLADIRLPYADKLSKYSPEHVEDVYRSLWELNPDIASNLHAGGSLLVDTLGRRYESTRSDARLHLGPVVFDTELALKLATAWAWSRAAK